MTPRNARQQARTAGAAYLVIIVLGVFAEAVREWLVVDGDAATTAQRILDHQPLFRAGFAAGVVVLLCNVVVVTVFLALFRAVSQSLATLMALFGLVSVAIEGANLINQAAALVVLQDGARFQDQAYQPGEQLRRVPRPGGRVAPVPGGAGAAVHRGDLAESVARHGRRAGPVRN